MTPRHFDDPDFVARYAEGPPKYVPGYVSMQAMAAQLLAERAGNHAEVLVLGAGGGLELAMFADRQPDWRFVAVDPSAEMLRQAEQRLGDKAERVRWVRGLIADAPPGPFDGASCLLTLHFVPDDGSKLDTLRAIRSRLKPGAPFVVVDQCLDAGSPDYALWLDRYARFALNSKADPDQVAEAVKRIRAEVNTVSAEREVALLTEAGFRDIDLFYAGLSWRGWAARA